jgi:nucleoside 2-deoxyribosyltransferase
MAEKPNKCFLTGLDYTREQTHRDALEYDIQIDNQIYRLSFHWDHKNSRLVDENRHIVKGLLLNKKWKPNEDILTNEFLENLIRNSSYPKSPKDKMDNLLLTIHKRQKYEGHKIELSSTDETRLIAQCYMQNREEVLFYLNTLREVGFVKFGGTLTKGSYNLGPMTFTFKGLEYLVSLEDNGQFSKNCFIAMSFSDSAIELRKHIKEIVVEAGYTPILIDEVDYDSDVTINDAIISQIKKCKFLIADFTEQKHGVYFEAGYALGLKRPVIYTCKNEDFKNSHFDTNHYPHIVYSTMEELATALKNKIGALID